MPKWDFAHVQDVLNLHILRILEGSFHLTRPNLKAGLKISKFENAYYNVGRTLLFSLDIMWDDGDIHYIDLSS